MVSNHWAKTRNQNLTALDHINWLAWQQLPHHTVCRELRRTRRLPSRLFHSHPSHPQTWVALHTTDRAMSVGCSRTPQTVTRRDIASDARLARNFLHIDVFVRVRTFDILLFAAPHFLYLSLPIFTPNQRTLFRLPALVVLSRPGQCGLDSRCA